MVAKREYARVLSLLVLATLAACGSTSQETPSIPTAAPAPTATATAEPAFSASRGCVCRCGPLESVSCRYKAQKRSG